MPFFRKSFNISNPSYKLNSTTQINVTALIEEREKKKIRK